MADEQILSIAAKLREAGRHTVIYGLGSVVQSAAGLILLPILTGMLSHEQFGAYSMLLMASSIASAVCYLGMTSALPRSYYDYSAEEDRRAVFTTAFLMLLAGALLQALLGYLLAAEISTALVGDEGQAEAVRYALAGAAIGFVNAYFFGYLRLLKRSVAAVLFGVISLAATIGLTMFLLAQGGDPVVAAFEAITFAQAIIFLCFLGIYGKVALVPQIMIGEVGKLVHFGMSSVVASFGSLLVDSLDRLMIQHYLGLAGVGVFSAAVRVSFLINVVLVLPFTQIWSPMAMEYRESRNVHDLFTHAFSAFMMLGGLVVLVAALFAGELLPFLIRSGISPSVVMVFLTCMLGLLLSGATNFVSAGLFYERKVHLLPVAYYAVASLKFLCCMVLIPLLGVAGAALAAFFAYLALPMGVYALSRKYFEFPIEWRRLSVFAVIVAPSLAYGYIYVFLPVSVYLRIAWLIVTLFLVARLCFSAAERQLFRAMLAQLSPLGKEAAGGS